LRALLKDIFDEDDAYWLELGSFATANVSSQGPNEIEGLASLTALRETYITDSACLDKLSDWKIAIIARVATDVVYFHISRR
jgi:hypothetical protein